METIPLLKVIIAGDDKVGKTSLIQQYCVGRISDVRMITIGVDFKSKLVPLPGETVKLSMWDLAGEERFQSIRTSFYRGSLAAALVYDLTQPDSLRNLAKWYLEINKAIPNQKFIVVGNKSDLAAEPTDRIGVQFAAVIHADYFCTSALTGDGVVPMFESLARSALSARPASQAPTE